MLASGECAKAPLRFHVITYNLGIPHVCILLYDQTSKRVPHDIHNEYYTVHGYYGNIIRPGHDRSLTLMLQRYATWITKTNNNEKYGGPEGTSLPYKNLTISLKLCHPSLKNIVVFCVNVTVLYRNERLFLKRLRSFPGLSSASSIKIIT